MTTRPIRIGADVGGTFTDVIVMDDDGNVLTHKVPSTPPDYEQAVLRAVEMLLHPTPTPTLARDEERVAGEGVDSLLLSRVFGGTGEGLGMGVVTAVAHGTTVATNAVLEQRGAKTALITTRGFRDVLELRRIRAPQMYDLFWTKPEPLVERYLRFEITERMSATGEVLIPLVESELQDIKHKLELEHVESIAVCFLHAYAFPQHELIVGEFLRRELPHVPVSLSHEVLRERKEYERTATTVVNAYVRPLMQRYLDALRGGLRAQGIDAPLLIMQSAGGLTPEEEAAVRPVYVLESGPAAGVLAAAHVAQQLGIRNVITLDVGGTTAKASMVEDGRIAHSPEYEVGASLSAGNRLVGGGGDRIRAPTIDIAEVGSGGGSVAFLDRAGGLRVGPRSAGAVPGPACYGRGGTAPTVTDANVVLGYIHAGKLADGAITVDLDAATRAIHDHVAKPMGLDVMHAAEGIHRIANARTMRALRAVSTERGRDPRDFVLMAFGGSGPIHAAGLARELTIGQVIVPQLPGLFSALGLLFAGIVHHDARSCLLSSESLTADALERIRAAMTQRMLAQFAHEGFAPQDVHLSCSADARFRGQASEIQIQIPNPKSQTPTSKLQLPTPSDAGRTDSNVQPLTSNDIVEMGAAFEAEHQRLYGHGSDPDNPIEVIAVRLVGRAGAYDVSMKHHARETDANAATTRRAYFGAHHGLVETPVLARHAIAGTLRGPLLIDEYDSTTVVPPDFLARLDEQNNLVLSAES